MSPINYIETTHIDQKTLAAANLEVSQVTTGTIDEADQQTFLIGRGHNQKKVEVHGNGEVSVSQYPFKNPLDHFRIKTQSGRVTFTDTSSGDSVELNYFESTRE